MNNYQKLYHSSNQHFTAYHKTSTSKNNKQGIIFLGGFKSDMNGTKAQAISAYAEKNDLDFIKFDYSGHGSSSGEFIEGSIDSWLKETLDVIDQLTDKPQILIGSSMGGWIMLLAAIARPARIAALIGLAAAPDFTEELIWNCLSNKQKEQLLAKQPLLYRNEFCQNAYLISSNLVFDSRQHLLLDKKILIDAPIHLIHGMEDKDVPFSTTIRIAQQVTSKNVRITLLKNSGHNLSQPQDLEFIYKAIEEALL